MILDTEYIQTQLKYSIGNAESEGINVQPFDVFDVYPTPESNELISVMVIDYIDLKKKEDKSG